MADLAGMMARHGRTGRVEWIGLRPARRSALVEVREAEIDEYGLRGDHGGAGKRAVTLIQAEHLPVIAAFLGRGDVAPGLLRRNILVSGVNLAGLRKREARLGEAVLWIEGPCPPCSRMEEALGFGGYSAMRGHGGYYASVLGPGRVAVGDPVEPVMRRR